MPSSHLQSVGGLLCVKQLHSLSSSCKENCVLRSVATISMLTANSGTYEYFSSTIGCLNLKVTFFFTTQRVFEKKKHNKLSISHKRSKLKSQCPSKSVIVMLVNKCALILRKPSFIFVKISVQPSLEKTTNSADE